MKPAKPEDAFRKAYEEHADAIFRHCYFRVFDREIAKELTQDAFMKTWDYLAKKKNIDNIRAFLYKTATNLIIDHSRKKKHRNHGSLETLQENGFEPVKQQVEPSTQADIGLALEKINRLSKTYRDVIYLRYVQGFGPKEIASRLDLTENVVSVRLNRGLKKLQKRFV